MNYQPKFSDFKHTKSAEALFRMKNPADPTHQASVNPEVVFYLFKKYNHEHEVVLKQIDTVMRDMRQNGVLDADPNYKVSINVAIDSLNNDLISKIINSGGKHAVMPRNIQIEILETEDFSKLAEKKDVIDALRRMGVSFALDDFGSRNAKDFGVLKTLDYDEVKLDKCLLDDAKRTGDFSHIKEYYEAIKKELPAASVVMEGVEGENRFGPAVESCKTTEQVVEHLKNIGEMRYQGFGFKKPLSPADFGDVVAKSNNYAPPTFGA